MPPCFSTQATASIDDLPVVTTSSTISTRDITLSPIGGLARGEVITPAVVRREPARPPAAGAEDAAERPPVERGFPERLAPRRTADTARDQLVAAMEEAGWVQAKAARLLGMTPRQIGYALRKHGVEIRRI